MPVTPLAKPCLESKINANKIIIIFLKKTNQIKNASQAFYLKGTLGAAKTMGLWFSSPPRPRDSGAWLPASHSTGRAGRGRTRSLAPQQRQKAALALQPPPRRAWTRLSLPGCAKATRSPLLPICLGCRFLGRVGFFFAAQQPGSGTRKGPF